MSKVCTIHKQQVIHRVSSVGAVTTPEFAALRLDPYDGPNAVPIIIGDVCCLLFLLWFLYRESKKLMKEKKKYFLVSCTKGKSTFH